MLTISIAEALQGPAAWSEWGHSDAEALAAAEAWQQQLAATGWGLDASQAEGGLAERELGLCAEDPSLWNPWSADAGLSVWPQEGLSSLKPPEVPGASLAHAAATSSMCEASAAPAVASGAVKHAPAREAAWASPLRVPLPEPLAVQPFSDVELGMEMELCELAVENVLSESPIEEPQKISGSSGLGASTLPPGLRAQSGPGALLDAAVAAAATARAPEQPPGVTIPAPTGMTIRPGEVGGQACMCVDWKIDDFSGKLQASMGRPVVSPAFHASGLSNLRLMVFPDARNAVKSARSHERKGLYANMVKKGPLYGSLKLKADGLERATVMTFALTVGGVRAGPHVYDFSEQAVLGMEDFGIDWLQQVDRASGSLRVGIEIIDVQRK